MKTNSFILKVPFVLLSTLLFVFSGCAWAAERLTDITIGDGENHEVCFTSGQTVYLEGFCDGRWVGRYWSADGRINVPHERWAEGAFEIKIKGCKVKRWEFVRAIEMESTERGARHFIVELTANEPPLKVKMHTLIDGTPIITRWLEITNNSGKPLPLSTVSPWASKLWPEHENNFTAGYFTRDGHESEGWFEWERLKNGTKVVESHLGRAHDDPFFIVRCNTIGEYFIGHLAWSMNWKMEFRLNRDGFMVSLGPDVDGVVRVISPGETIETPAVHMGPVSGDMDDAVQAMHEHIRRSVHPTPSSERSYLTQYLVPSDQGYYMPFDESSIMKCIDVAAAIGSELFILDFGWFDVTCDWEPSPTRFPNGIKPLIDYAHQKGMLFGFFVEAEGGRGNVEKSRVAREHPEWIGRSKVIDLSNPKAAAWVGSEICRLIEEYDIDLFRLDYNPDFKFASRDHCGAGISENNCWRYYEAFYGMYKRVRKKYPDVILQQAASGGARLDLGTIGCFHENQTTDGLYVQNELRVFSGLTLGLPPEVFVIFHGAYNNGAMVGCVNRFDTVLRISYSTGIPQIFAGTVAPSVEQLSPQRRAMFLHYNRLYKDFIRPLLPTCKVYHHEPINAQGGIESSGWFVMEFTSPDKSKGWALLVHIGETESDHYLLRMRGLDPTKSYNVIFDSLRSETRLDATKLVGDGLSIRLEDIGSSELLLFEAEK